MIIGESLDSEHTHPRLSSLYKRWFPTTLLVTGRCSSYILCRPLLKCFNQGQSNPFTLSVARTTGKEDQWQTQATFELSPNHIYFRGLSFNQKLLRQLEEEAPEPPEVEQVTEETRQMQLETDE